MLPVYVCSCAIVLLQLSFVVSVSAHTPPYTAHLLSLSYLSLQRLSEDAQKKKGLHSFSHTCMVAPEVAQHKVNE